MQRHLLTCTFCKRSEQQVRKLVAGPGVYICDRCTEHAHAIIHEDAGPPMPSAILHRVASRFRRLTDRRSAAGRPCTRMPLPTAARRIHPEPGGRRLGNPAGPKRRPVSCSDLLGRLRPRGARQRPPADQGRHHEGEQRRPHSLEENERGHGKRLSLAQAERPHNRGRPKENAGSPEK